MNYEYGDKIEDAQYLNYDHFIIGVFRVFPNLLYTANCHQIAIQRAIRIPKERMKRKKMLILNIEGPKKQYFNTNLQIEDLFMTY